MRKTVISAIFLFATIQLAIAADDLPVNPNVTPENIDETICVRGWSQSVRPPQVYTDRVKKHLMREAGLPLDTIGDYILDHRINIAIGGSPTSLQNLQLQDRTESLAKDKAENRAHSLVCTHRLSLRDAQAKMYTNWRALLPTR